MSTGASYVLSMMLICAAYPPTALVLPTVPTRGEILGGTVTVMAGAYGG